ncbi:biotin/lipoyl-binding protein [Candidatus Woesearchaeota archaeon]|nr:biotin/lipoyl-binding protein [Candidatus Woesearchaeota archaeon]
MQNIKVRINGEEHLVKVEELDSGKLLVRYGTEAYEVQVGEDIGRQVEEELAKDDHEQGSGTIRAPLPGIIFSIDVKIGEHIAKGRKLLSLMAMKMENEIISAASGKVKEILVKQHQTVQKGDVLMVIG